MHPKRLNLFLLSMLATLGLAGFSQVGFEGVEGLDEGLLVLAASFAILFAGLAVQLLLRPRNMQTVSNS